MKAVLKIFKRTYRNVLQSIAFYPVLMALIFIITAVIALEIDGSEIAQSVKKKIPFLFIQDYETARSILSTFIGGILSLTVFSFTMVMVVLGQASSDFSPRLLPSLISNKRHQIILGVYIGTLLYCTIVLISLGAYGLDSNTLGLSTMLAALLSVACIGLFVYFIHSISRAIQIHNIIDGIYENCASFLDEGLKRQGTREVGLQYIDTKDWTVFCSNKTGYFRGFDTDLLTNSLKEKENQIEIIPYLNQHIWRNEPALRVRGQVSDDEKKNLIFCLNISSDRHEEDRGIGGLIKLMEIAVKAMSPGINDPGTAIDAVTKLGELLSKFLQFPQIVSEPLPNKNLILIKNSISAEELMRVVVQPIRLYAKKDSTVVYELIEALCFVKKSPNLSNDNKAAVNSELEALRADLDRHIDNETDKQRILKRYQNSLES